VYQHVYESYQGAGQATRANQRLQARATLSFASVCGVLCLKIEKMEILFCLLKTGVGVGQVAAVFVGCSGLGCILKKAIAKISVDIQIRRRPSPKSIISTAPISNTNPVVENNP